jgi:hypothetical protein
MKLKGLKVKAKRTLQTRINYALVLKTTLEEVRDLKDFIEGTLPNTFIVYQRTAPGWVRLIVREDGGGRR